MSATTSDTTGPNTGLTTGLTTGGQEYALGFAFDRYGRVALIRKVRPAWQAGLLNGIGGKIEPGESPEEAMVREFCEETGTRVTGWEKFAIVSWPGGRLHVFRRLGLEPKVLEGLRTTTDEEVFVSDPPTGPQAAAYAVPNLTWLLPLAAYTGDQYEVIEVRSAAEASVVGAHATPEEVA